MNPCEEHIVFHHQLSIAITQWAQVELSLFDLVANCSARTDRKIQYKEFCSKINFRSKLKFSEEILLAKFKDNSSISDWNKLEKRLKNCADQRNQLAHRRLILFGNSVCGERYALVPGPNTKSNKISSETHNPPPGSLCLIDILKIRLEFFALNISLMNFSSRLAGESEQFPKSSEKAMDPPTISSLKMQIYEILGVPQKTVTE